MVLSGADGYYSISGFGLNSGGDVLATKVGYASVLNMVWFTGDMRLDIQMSRIAKYTLSGEVWEMTPGGRVPVPGARVDEFSSEDAPRICCLGFSQTTFTDAKGFYTFSGYIPERTTAFG